MAVLSKEAVTVPSSETVHVDEVDGFVRLSLAGIQRALNELDDAKAKEESVNNVDTDNSDGRDPSNHS